MFSVLTGELLTSPPEKGDYIGVLKEDYVQVDFDDAQSKEIALQIVHDYKLKCDILETSRGIHLYFKDDGWHKSQVVHGYTAMGLMCDLGLGAKNRQIPLRMTKSEEVKKIINGHEVVKKISKEYEREWLQVYDELDTLPPYFRVITKHNFDFQNCESRNQTLFDYILKLQFEGFSMEESRKTLRVINKYMFKEPLTDKELDTIARDDAFKKESFFEKSNFLHDRFGNYMLANSHILKIDNVPHIYTNNHVYSSNQKDFEKVMIGKIPSLKEAQRKEVYKYIGLKVQKEANVASPSLIGVRDGILNLRDMTI